MRPDSHIVTFLLFPLIGIILQIVVKLLVKLDPSFKREDFAVGFESLTNAFITFVALTGERALDWARTDQALRNTAGDVTRAALEAHRATLEEQVTWAAFGMFAMIVVLLVLAAIVRKWGRVRLSCGHEEPTLVVGTILPDCIGFSALVSVAVYFSS
jgi:uncharacterized membrane protein YgcG